MKKIVFLLGFLFLLIGNVCAQEIPIILEDPDGPIGTDNPRSGTLLEPFATLNNKVLTLQFPVSTVSQVIISDQNTNAILYSESFASTTQVVVDLEDEGIGEGSYTLWLFAFDKWWWGEFVIEEE